MNDFDNFQDDIQPEGPLPFWLKATLVVLAIPIVNSIFPGTVAGLATFFGLPDPAELRVKAHQSKSPLRQEVKLRDAKGTPKRTDTPTA